MKKCTFFGHRDCPDSIRPRLLAAIQEQIKAGTTAFTVGSQGNFDRLVFSCLRELKREEWEVFYTVVLAGFPAKTSEFAPDETFLPEGIERVPRRFAIDYRNRWMLDRSDVVIVYAVRPYGSAAKWAERAMRKGKHVIKL